MVGTLTVITQLVGFEVPGGAVFDTVPISDNEISVTSAVLPFLYPASQKPIPGAFLTSDTFNVRCSPHFKRTQFLSDASLVRLPAFAPAVDAPPDSATAEFVTDSAAAPKDGGTEALGVCSAPQQPMDQCTGCEAAVLQAASGPELDELLRLPAQEVCNQRIELDPSVTCAPLVLPCILFAWLTCC